MNARGHAVIEVSAAPARLAATESTIVTLNWHNLGDLDVRNLVASIVVPAELGLESGLVRVEALRIPPGGVHGHPLRLHPTVPGMFTVGVRSLSVRYGGRGCRLDVPSPLIEVEQARESVAPARDGRRMDRDGHDGSLRVFVSYRRSDSDVFVESFARDLARPFPDVRVFLDRLSLVPGTRWRAAIDAELLACRVLIAFIGPDWLEARNGSGRRIDQPDDEVRREIATALARGIPVIPVVYRTSMPSRAQLPDAIAALADHHALHLVPGFTGQQVLELAMIVRSHLVS